MKILFFNDEVNAIVLPSGSHPTCSKVPSNIFLSRLFTCFRWLNITTILRCLNESGLAGLDLVVMGKDSCVLSGATADLYVTAAHGLIQFILEQDCPISFTSYRNSAIPPGPPHPAQTHPTAGTLQDCVQRHHKAAIC